MRNKLHTDKKEDASLRFNSQGEAIIVYICMSTALRPNSNRKYGCWKGIFSAEKVVFSAPKR
jgi:hypothetical protein